MSKDSARASLPAVTSPKTTGGGGSSSIYSFMLKSTSVTAGYFGSLTSPTAKQTLEPVAEKSSSAGAGGKTMAQEAEEEWERREEYGEMNPDDLNGDDIDDEADEDDAEEPDDDDYLHYRRGNV